MIQEQYVSFEIAKLLKEKGFDEDINLWYTENGEKFFQYKYEIKFDWRVRQNQNVYLCPTHQMAMKWLREVHKIGIFPTTFYRHTKTFDGHNYGCTLVNLKTFDVIGNFEDCTFPADSFEEACEAAIKYCLENLI